MSHSTQLILVNLAQVDPPDQQYIVIGKFCARDFRTNTIKACGLLKDKGEPKRGISITSGASICDNRPPHRPDPLLHPR